MTDIDLDAIEARRRDVENVAAAIGAMPESVTHNVATIAALGTAAALSSADVPALVAEMRRLQEAVGEIVATLRSPRNPILHSRHEIVDWLQEALDPEVPAGGVRSSHTEPGGDDEGDPAQER